MLAKLGVFLVFVIGLNPIDGTYNNEVNKTKFPKEFKFGVSTSAYQIEGGWIEDGKGWSVWDYMTHTQPDKIRDHSNADIAADSYHLYKRDVEMLEELGVRNYKFSIAWTRIFPNGSITSLNAKGIAYYNALIDELLAKGIEPFAYMTHWDLPQSLQDKGGLLSDRFATWFADYARVLFQNFGDRVKYWVTFNEPSVQCSIVYEINIHAPVIHNRLSGRDVYHCNRNILLAHAKVYHMYAREFRRTQKGKIAINVYGDWAIPKSNSTDDIEATKDFLAFGIGMYMDPIYKGNYPQRVIDRVALMSSKQGLNSSRLQPFTYEEVNYIRGTSDFVALNHYSTNLVYRNSSLQVPLDTGKIKSPSFHEDCMCGTDKDLNWRLTPIIWEHAEGLTELLIYIRDHYHNPAVYILENGIGTKPGLVDDAKIHCLRNYLKAVHNAIVAGANVKGYFFWTLMDNFEWDKGYTERHGLYEVDFNDPERPRTPRKSAFVYKEIIRSRVIDYDYNPSVLIGLNGATTVTFQALIGLVISVMVSILN